MSGDISLACPTLTKMLLHAARYPQLAVSGVVLAQARGGDTTSSTITLIDAVPLFHLQLSLAPMLEVALTQVTRYLSVIQTSSFSQSQLGCVLFIFEF